MFKNHKLLGFRSLTSKQYSQLVAEKILTTEIQAKIGGEKSDAPAK